MKTKVRVMGQMARECDNECVPLNTRWNVDLNLFLKCKDIEKCYLSARKWRHTLLIGLDKVRGPPLF